MGVSRPRFIGCILGLESLDVLFILKGVARNVRNPKLSKAYLEVLRVLHHDLRHRKYYKNRGFRCPILGAVLYLKACLFFTTFLSLIWSASTGTAH